MKKIFTLSALLLFFLGLAGLSQAEQVTVFGPEQYTRTKGRPNVYTDSFSIPKPSGEGRLIVKNGREDGKHRISSAVIYFNGEQVFGPSHFNQKVSELEATVNLLEQNTLSLNIRSKPESYLTVEVIQYVEADADEFYEEFPAWRMPELAITKLTVTPERVDPGETVILKAEVSNAARGITPSANLVFLLDDAEIARLPVEPFSAGESSDFSTTWEAEGSGKHAVRAELEIEEGGFDGSLANNFMVGVARVSGEADPQGELQFVDIDFDALHLIPGESCLIPVKIRNPGFGDIGAFKIKFYMDENYAFEGDVDYLPSGGEMEFQVPWDNITPGEHNIVARITAVVSNQEIELLVKSWHAAVPDKTVVYTDPYKDKWVSIGPQILSNNWASRMNTIAFHPDYPESKIIYAGGTGSDMAVAHAPGVWKTTNGGDIWVPIGDKLSSLMISSLAVDPRYANIVYAGGYGGIFKSMDGGNNWWNFANRSIAKDVSELFVSYTSSDEVLIYARTPQGVLRYKAGNPLNEFSEDWEWNIIKKGNIRDIAVHPNNHSIVYASIKGEGIYRTTIGELAKEETNPGDHDWAKLSSGLPSITEEMSVTLDIHRIYPNLIYAGITKPETDIDFSIYKSEDGGDSWETHKKYAKGELDEAVYNPYIRVVPRQATESYLPEIIYFGGVCLYQFINYDAFPGQEVFLQSGTLQVSGYQVGLRAGVDLKALEFDPENPDEYYYSVGDQGIFRGKISTTPEAWTLKDKEYGKSGDQFTHRNNNLRVTQFYDFDVSKTNPNLIIGGTQDTGTIRYDGNPIWKMIKSGDGLYSLINPNNNDIMYGQHQSLNSTRRSFNGGASWPLVFPTGLPQGYGLGGGYMTMDLAVSDSVIAVGDGEALYYIQSGGAVAPWFIPYFWDKENDGKVTYVIVHPTDYDWIIGTSTGKIFCRKSATEKKEIFSHPFKARVGSLSFSPLDPDILYATFYIGGSHKDTRIWAFEIDPSTSEISLAENITKNFPENLFPRVIVGDPFDKYTAYIGTERGVWRYNKFSEGMFPWEAYNDGLPLTSIVDLLIAPDNKLLAATKGRGAWSVITWTIE